MALWSPLRSPLPRSPGVRTLLDRGPAPSNVGSQVSAPTAGVTVEVEGGRVPFPPEEAGGWGPLSPQIHLCTLPLTRSDSHVPPPCRLPGRVQSRVSFLTSCPSLAPAPRLELYAPLRQLEVPALLRPRGRARVWPPARSAPRTCLAIFLPGLRSGASFQSL